MTTLQAQPGEDWELIQQLEYYTVRLVPLDQVPVKEEQYLLHYAMVNNETNRVEGYAPTLAAAMDTIRLLNAATQEYHRYKEAQSVAEFALPKEEPPVLLTEDAPTGLPAGHAGVTFGPAKLTVTRQDGSKETEEVPFTPAGPRPEGEDSE